jgi:hypothetical protein
MNKQKQRAEELFAGAIKIADAAARCSAVAVLGR